MCIITVKLLHCSLLEHNWCKLPEDGDYAETCRGTRIIYKTAQLLVLIESVN